MGVQVRLGMLAGKVAEFGQFRTIAYRGSLAALKAYPLKGPNDLNIGDATSYSGKRY